LWLDSFAGCRFPGLYSLEVELEPGLELYRLPDEALSAPEIADAVRVSLDFMDLAPERITAPLLARQGRGRMTSGTTLRRSYSPRGVVVATAEALPDEGPAFEGAAVRALSINLSRHP
jgi:hypothetical protein